MTDDPAVLLLVDDDEAKRYVATWLRRAGPHGDRGGHRAEGAGPGQRRRAGPARRQPARHQRLRGLPADQGRPADRGDPGDPGVRHRGRRRRPGAGPDPGRRRLPGRSGRARGTAGHGGRRAAVLPRPAARRAIGGPADRADQRDAGHQRRRRPSTGWPGPRPPGQPGSSARRPCVVLAMPDGQTRRTSASPQQPQPRQRGGPAELADRIAGPVLAAGQISAAAVHPARRLAPADPGQHAARATSAWPSPGRSRAGRRWPGRRRGRACPARRNCRSSASSSSSSRWPSRPCAPSPRST